MIGSQQIERRANWLSGAVLSGFIATAAMSIVIVFAYGAAGLLGSPNPESPAMLRWMWRLANNTVTQSTQTAFPIAAVLHFVSGIGWGVVYAGVMEPRLQGPGWRRGLIFSFLPWALSVVAFLPAVGAGPLGLSLGAGPLPILGNLILHLAYGAVLGHVYGPAGERFQTESGDASSIGDSQVLASEQRTMALGVVGGLLLGGVAGWLASAVLGVSGQPIVAAVIGAVAGSLAGAFIASFAGLSPE